MIETSFPPCRLVGRLLPRRALAVVLAVLGPWAWGVAGAEAQIMLPGAAPPQAGSASPDALPAPAAPKPKPKPLPPKAISDQSIDGKTFYLNGSRGRLTVEKRDRQSLTMQLIAVGEKISRPTETCGVDLGAGQPLTLSAAGRPQGVTRYEMAMPGCPVAFDVLDGGLFVPPDTQACEFTEADCRINLHGVWGPPATVVEGEAGAIERDRGRAEKTVRESYKTLLSKVPKGDKAGIRKIASEQAGFTSERETICRDYARESAHGFCATRFTEYRAASLAARLGQAPAAEAEARRKPKLKPKPKPKTVAPAVATDPLTGLPM